MKGAATSGATGNKAGEWIQPSANQKPASNEIGGEEPFGYDADVEVDKSWWASHGVLASCTLEFLFHRNYHRFGIINDIHRCPCVHQIDKEPL